MLDAEAAEESRSGRELAALLSARLDAARHASEKLLGVLQLSLAQHADSCPPARWVGNGRLQTPSEVQLRYGE